jgi:hypothetical protein
MARRFNLLIMVRLGDVAKVGLVVVFVSSCGCDREGCEALDASAADNGETGVAGVVAFETDLSVNGCTECGFGSATLQFRPTQAAVTSQADAQAVVDAGPPTVTASATGEYRQALEPGTYLACTERYCANAAVVRNHVTTFHVRTLDGPPQFFSFDSASARYEVERFTVVVD